MWCIEAKAKIDIPLDEDVAEWTKSQLIKFIESKKTFCSEYKEAINWLRVRDYKKAKEAIRDCEKKLWLDWLHEHAPKGGDVIKAGTPITITYGRHEKYALWGKAIWDLPEEYVGETIRVISES